MRDPIGEYQVLSDADADTLKVRFKASADAMMMRAGLLLSGIEPERLGLKGGEADRDFISDQKHRLEVQVQGMDHDAFERVHERAGKVLPRLIAAAEGMHVALNAPMLRYHNRDELNVTFVADGEHSTYEGVIKRLIPVLREFGMEANARNKAKETKGVLPVIDIQVLPGMDVLAQMERMLEKYPPSVVSVHQAVRREPEDTVLRKAPPKA